MFTPRLLDEGLYLPDYDSNSIMNLANFILEHFEADYKYKPLDINNDVQNLEKKKKIVLLVIDAMGDINLTQASEKIPELKQELDIFKRKRITSVFPSTTTAALTTLFTGVPPIEHGILGYSLYLEEFQTLTNMILFSPRSIDKYLPRDSLLKKDGISAENFIEQDTIFGKLSKKRVSCHVITASQFSGTGLTRIHTKGCNHAVNTYLGITEMFTKMKDTLDRSDGKTFIKAYWGLSDSYAHKNGPYSRLYQYELRNVFRLFRELVLEQMSDKEREETLFLITADHGQIETPKKYEELLYKSDYANYSIRGPVSGEYRASYINVKDNSVFDRTFIKDYEDKFMIIEKNQAIEKGLFSGSELEMDMRLFNKNIARIGDYIVMGRDKYSLHTVDGKTEKKPRGMMGKHGSLTPEELFVPLLIYS